MKATLRDPSLPHQVVLDFSRCTGLVLLTCNCRKRARARHVGSTKDLDQSRQMYNDPDNHMEPFGEEDKARW